MKRYLCVILAWLHLATIAMAGGKYVSASASGTGDGSIGDPWNWTQANANMSNADSVYVRGGYYTSTINPASDGTSGSYIIITRYPGERPIWNNQADMADLSGNDYIELSGLIGTNITGDAITLGKAGSGNYRLLRDTVYNLASASGRLIVHAEDINGLEIAYCKFDRADTNGKTVTNGSADLFNTFGSYDLKNVYIHHSDWRRCGHSPINFKNPSGYTDGVIISNNLFYGGRRCGPDLGSASNYVVQHNTMVFAESVSTTCRIGTAWQAVDFTNSQGIIRWNIVYVDSATITRTSSVGGAWDGSAFSGWSLNTPYNDETMQHHHFYHNTYDLWTPVNVAMEFAMVISANYDVGITGDYVRPVAIKNNIMIGPRTSDADEAIFLQRDPNSNYGDMQQTVMNNILKCTNSSYVTYITSADESGLKTLSWAQTNYPSMWSGNSETIPASWSHTNPTYVLAAGDNGVGDAGPLTTTSNSGSNATTMTLTNSRYFTDGMGMVPGDTIYVSGMTPSAWATISSITYSTHSVTLGQSRTWSSSANVYAFKNGEVADDLGAMQLTASEPPADPGIQYKILVR